MSAHTNYATHTNYLPARDLTATRLRVFLTLVLTWLPALYVATAYRGRHRTKPHVWAQIQDNVLPRIADVLRRVGETTEEMMARDARVGRHVRIPYVRKSRPVSPRYT